MRLTALMLISLLLAACDDSNNDRIFGPAKPQPENPTVSGPITGGGGEDCCRITLAGFEIDLRNLGYIPGTPFYTFLEFDELEVGYRETEYFFSGIAASYIATDEVTSNGYWAVEPAQGAEYTSRMVVQRPLDDADFNGTVVVEWFNVTGGLDSAITWMTAHTELVREGYVWVGISAQAAGIEGGGAFDLSLKAVDRERYGELHHPGDSFSYDIYSQGAQAVRRPLGVDPLEGLTVERVIAAGQSQSASRLTTYYNAIQPTIDLFDGFLIQSRSSRSSPLSQAPQAEVPTPDPVLIRDDLLQPVIMLQAETDLSGLSLQPDSSRFRLWEVAGSSHSDAYIAVKAPFDRGDDPAVADVISTTSARPPFIECPLPVNDGPMHWVTKAAIAALDRWTGPGDPAPEGAPLTLNADRTGFELDGLGNALGGIRTSYVDAPVAKLSGLGNDDGLCRLFGTTVLFGDAQLAELYPTRADYVNSIDRATDDAVDAGFLVPADAALIKERARQVSIGGQ